MLEGDGAKTKTMNWDNLIIQLADGDKSLGKIRIRRMDLENLMSIHEVGRGEILDMLILAFEVENGMEKKEENGPEQA